MKGVLSSLYSNAVANLHLETAPAKQRPKCGESRRKNDGEKARSESLNHGCEYLCVL